MRRKWCLGNLCWSHSEVICVFYEEANIFKCKSFTAASYCKAGSTYIVALIKPYLVPA